MIQMIMLIFQLPEPLHEFERLKDISPVHMVEAVKSVSESLCEKPR